MKFQYGSKHPNWKGGRTIDLDGYIRIKNWQHPFHDSRGYVREHRLVYEEYYHCILLSWVDLHHKNGNKRDNRIENLLPMSKSQHSILEHTKDMSDRICVKCGNNKTHIEPNGTPHWRRRMCSRCYNKSYYQRKAGSSRITPSINS